MTQLGKNLNVKIWCYLRLLFCTSRFQIWLGLTSDSVPPTRTDGKIKILLIKNPFNGLSAQITDGSSQMDNNFFQTWAQVWKEIHIHLWLPSVNPSLFATAHPLATHPMPSSPPPPITMNINPNAASLFFFEALSMMASSSMMTPLCTSNIMPLTISLYRLNDIFHLAPLMTMKHWNLYDGPSNDGTTLMH